MKNIWQNAVCKILTGTLALSLVFVAGCGDDSVTGPKSEEKVKSSSSSIDDESSSSVEDDSESSSSEEKEIESSSSKKRSSSSAKSSSSSKKTSSSSAKSTSSSSKIPFSFSSSSRKAKSSSSRSSFGDKVCSEVEHTGTAKTLTGSSDNQIPGTQLTFHNEFQQKNVGSATYYTDGSFKFSWNDESNGLARMQVASNSGKPYDELGEIVVEYTAAMEGSAEESYVGASAYASSNDGMQVLNVYVVEAWFDEFEPIVGGKPAGSVELDGSEYEVFKDEEQMVQGGGVQKTLNFYLVRTEPRLCGIINMSAVFDEIEEMGAPNIPLRWVAVSAEMEYAENAVIDVQEAKIQMGDKDAFEVDGSDASDDFCKADLSHEGDETTLSENDEVELTVGEMKYVVENYGSEGGSVVKYYENASFVASCEGNGGEECLALMYSVFDVPTMYSDTGRINVEYSFTKEGGKGQSIIGAYGVMENFDNTTKVEFYVMEDWLESFPMTGEFGDKQGEFSLDGGEYEVYQSCTKSGKVTSCHVTSVRKEKRRCGTVNISGQMNQWKKLGMNMFPITKVGAMSLMTSGAWGEVDFLHVNVDVVEE